MRNITIVRAPLCYYRYIAWFVVISFSALTVSVAYNLNRLETWRVDTVWLPGPIAMVYDEYGFWPAVLVVPIIGSLCCAAFAYRIRALRAADKQKSLTTEVCAGV